MKCGSSTWSGAELSAAVAGRRTRRWNPRSLDCAVKMTEGRRERGRKNERKKRKKERKKERRIGRRDGKETILRGEKEKRMENILLQTERRQNNKGRWSVNE